MKKIDLESEPLDSCLFPIFVYVSDSTDLSKISVSMLLWKAVGYKKMTNSLANAAKYEWSFLQLGFLGKTGGQRHAE